MGLLFASLDEYWWVGFIPLALLLLLAAIFRHLFVVRIPLWILTHTIYRIRVHGLENLPASGPFLMVSNHPSYLDPLLILAATKGRVRFFMWAPFTRLPGLRWIVSWMKVIPIDGTAGPRAIIAALRRE